MKDYSKYVAFASNSPGDKKERNDSYRLNGQSDGYLMGKYFNGEIGAIDEEVKRIGLEMNALMKHMGVTLDENANNQLNSLIPTGSIIAMAVNVMPSGYVPCHGQVLNRTTYANLFGVLGETYGRGDGSTTFNVPDFRGMFLRGVGRGSSPIGQLQQDAGREFHGNLDLAVEGSGQYGTTFSRADGIFGFTERVSRRLHTGGGPTVGIGNRVDIWGSRSWGSAHTSNEFRPVNYAVEYYIKY